MASKSIQAHLEIFLLDNRGRRRLVDRWPTLAANRVLHREEIIEASDDYILAGIIQPNRCTIVVSDKVLTAEVSYGATEVTKTVDALMVLSTAITGLILRNQGTLAADVQIVHF